MNQNNISFTIQLKFATFFISLFFISLQSFSQNWSSDGNSYYRIENNEIKQYSLPENSSKVLVSAKQLTPKGSTAPLIINHFSFSNDQQKVLLFTNTIKVWRLNTKGDYWILDLNTGNLGQRLSRIVFNVCKVFP